MEEYLNSMYWYKYHQYEVLESRNVMLIMRSLYTYGMLVGAILFNYIQIHIQFLLMGSSLFIIASFIGLNQMQNAW